jgi:hypothetical protein
MREPVSLDHSIGGLKNLQAAIESAPSAKAQTPAVVRTLR